jgi:cell fate (sporulation/competence/biofilm development) regulator YlbF (YheA/YmcA/DUF963 family)
MNVYDTANNLAEEIRKSEIFKKLKESKEKLYTDPEKKQLIDDFEKLKQEVQIMEVKRQNNQEIDEQDKKEKLAKLYNVLIENKDIKDYFDYEISFNKMMYDINKIIGDTIKEVL